MRRLICDFVVRIWQKQVFLWHGSLYRDGRILAAGGRSRFIHLWALDTRKLLRIVELPEKVTSVKQLLFLPDNFDGGASQVKSYARIWKIWTPEKIAVIIVKFEQWDIIIK